MATLHEKLIAANLPVLGQAIEGTTVLWTRSLTPEENDIYEQIINPVWWEREQLRRGKAQIIADLQAVYDGTTTKTNMEIMRLFARTLMRILAHIT